VDKNMQAGMTHEQLQELLDSLHKDYNGPDGLADEVLRVSKVFAEKDCRAGVIMIALGAEAFDKGTSLDAATRSFLSLFAVGYTGQAMAKETGGGEGGKTS
jgi:hypothetical protein